MSWFDNVYPTDDRDLPVPHDPAATGMSGSGQGTPPPSWRTPRPNPREPRAPRPSRAWTVVSSTVLPGGGQAGLSTLVRVTCVLALVVAAVQSGLLSNLFTGVFLYLLDLSLPVIIVLVLLAIFLPRLGGVAAQITGMIVGAFASVVGAVLGVALRAPLSRGRAPEIPATSLHCRRPDGTTKEVRVAQLCNIAPGSQVSVVGPTLMGRVSAWWVRVHDTNQLIVARGIIPSLIVMAVTGTALWAIYH